MTRMPLLVNVPMLTVDATSAVPRYQQIYDALRRAILAGQLAPGTRLPATRALAAALGLSRNTVVNAFAQLIAEGYIEGKIGAGTTVASTLPDDLLHARPSAPPLAAYGGMPPRPIARRAGHLIQAAGPMADEQPVLGPFRTGIPDLTAFPFDIWGQIAARHWRAPDPALLAYGDPAGYAPLRAAIAAYLGEARAVRCTPERIIIVGGSQQGLDLATRILLDPGDEAWMEDPGYTGARGALEAAGARVIPIPVGAEGLDVAAGEHLAPAARLVYVSPSHQYPLGVTMSLRQRLDLLAWAERAAAWVLEDDYDSEYRYAGRPLAALQGLDRAGRVIYIGTFSKVLFPSLRLGYLVVPPDLARPFAAARALADRHSPTVEQAILADFIAEGHFARHIRRMRARYTERQTVLVAELQRAFPDRFTVTPAAAGMFLVARLPDESDDVGMARRLAARGIIAGALSAYYRGPSPRRALLLGYAAFTPEQIRAGVRQMRAILG